MRSHTAAHILAAVMNKEAGVLITGNQLEEEKVRFDCDILPDLKVGASKHLEACGCWIVHMEGHRPSDLFCPA